MKTTRLDYSTHIKDLSRKKVHPPEVCEMGWIQDESGWNRVCVLVVPPLAARSLFSNAMNQLDRNCILNIRCGKCCTSCTFKSNFSPGVGPLKRKEGGKNNNK